MALERLSERVYRYVDTCNVYVIARGERALLIDFGSGAILEHLSEIGVERVEWVLHTHHHRDQCQGDERLVGTETRIAVPARESFLFEEADTFWRHMKVHDVFECTNIWNTRARSIRVDHRIGDYELFEWEALQFLAQPTPGHTKGSVTYLAEIDGVRYAFCGDVIHSRGRVWTLYDLQWHYFEPDGLNVGLHSVHVLRQKRPQRLAPSHGDVMQDADGALGALEENMRGLYRLLGRGYADTTEFPLPAAVDSKFQQVSEHLIAVTHAFAHFYVLMAADGKALFFDYGFPSWDHGPAAGFRFVEHSLLELRERFGLREVEVMIPTHYHDDHVVGAKYLHERFGTEVWAFEAFAEILEHPEAYRVPAGWREPIAVTRKISDGETIEWADYRFTARHNPGHTHYATALYGEIDGRRVAITGDELERDATGLLRGSGPVYRNRLESDSFIIGVQNLIEFDPEMLLTGHNGPLEVTRADLEVALSWARELADWWHALAAMPEAVGFALDPDFVSIYPYQGEGRPAEPIELRVELRNHYAHAAAGSVAMIAPARWEVDPALREVNVAEGGMSETFFRLTPPEDEEVGVRHVVTVSAELGGRNFGEAAEALVTLVAR